MNINDSENVHVLIDYLDSVKKQESTRFKSSSCPISPKKSMPTIIKKVRMFTPENDQIESPQTETTIGDQK